MVRYEQKGLSERGHPVPLQSPRLKLPLIGRGRGGGSRFMGEQFSQNILILKLSVQSVLNIHNKYVTPVFYASLFSGVYIFWMADEDDTVWFDYDPCYNS